MHIARILVPAAVLALAACSRGPDVPAPWVAFLRSDTLTIAIDPGLTTWEMTHARVTLRMEHAALKGPPGKQYKHVELTEEVDCGARHVRDVDLRAYDAAGKELDDVRMRFRSWRPFREHPLGPEILDPVCKVLNG